MIRRGKDRLTTPIIREMANTKLFQRGLDAYLVDHSRVGILFMILRLDVSPIKKNRQYILQPESLI